MFAIYSIPCYKATNRLVSIASKIIVLGKTQVPSELELRFNMKKYKGSIGKNLGINSVGRENRAKWQQ